MTMSYNSHILSAWTHEHYIAPGTAPNPPSKLRHEATKSVAACAFTSRIYRIMASISNITVIITRFTSTWHPWSHSIHMTSMSTSQQHYIHIKSVSKLHHIHMTSTSTPYDMYNIMTSPSPSHQHHFIYDWYNIYIKPHDIQYITSHHITWPSHPAHPFAPSVHSSWEHSTKTGCPPPPNDHPDHQQNVMWCNVM